MRGSPGAVMTEAIVAKADVDVDLVMLFRRLDVELSETDLDRGGAGGGTSRSIGLLL